MLVKVGRIASKIRLPFYSNGSSAFCLSRRSFGGPSFAPYPQATFRHEIHCCPCGSIHNGSPIRLKRSLSL